MLVDDIDDGFYALAFIAAFDDGQRAGQNSPRIAESNAYSLIADIKP
jgi:hypothetical protein